MTKHAPNDFPDENTFVAVDPETAGENELFVAIFEDTIPLDSDYATPEEWDLPKMHIVALAQGRSGILRTMVDALEKWLNEDLPSFREPRTPDAVQQGLNRCTAQIQKKRNELEEVRVRNPKAWDLKHRGDEIRELEESILPRLRQDLKMLTIVTDLVARDRSSLDWSEPFEAGEVSDALQRWGCVAPDPVLGRVVEAALNFVAHEGYVFYLTPVTPVRG